MKKSIYTDQDIDESEWVFSLKKGNVCAFEKIYGFYSPGIYTNIQKMVKFPEVAEELLQDTFMRVWENRENIDLEKSFKSYIFIIAMHLVYDYFNKKAKERKIEAQLIIQSTEYYEHIEQELGFKETASILEKAVNLLPPQRKRVYFLCKLEGRSYEEVSKTLGISCSTISDHIVKATKAIQAYYMAEQANRMPDLKE